MPDKPKHPIPSLLSGMLRAVGSLGLVILFSILLIGALLVGIGIVTGGLFGVGSAINYILPWAPPALVLITPIILAYLLAVPFGGAYQPALMFRYLRRKLIPMFAILGVTLCVAMVIIVSSVMGGFLKMVRTSGKAMTGDVTLHTGYGGFARYDEVMQAIRELPEVEAATPIVIGYGLLKMPGHQFGFDQDQIKTVQVYGIDGPSYAAVTEYGDKIYWTRETLKKSTTLQMVYEDSDPKQMALNMSANWSQRPINPDDESPQPSEKIQVMVPGIEISPGNQRNAAGEYFHPVPLPGLKLQLTLLPVTDQGAFVEPSVQTFGVVNEFHSGLYDVDSNRIYIPFAEAQRMMLMQESDLVDPNDPFVVIGKSPAKATEVHVKAVEGVTPDELAEAIRVRYEELEKQYVELPPTPWMQIQTWEQQQSQYLRAIENEKGMLTILFGIISFVAVVMVGVVFYMIVLDKTKDIGILRSLGASRAGIASIFLGYGLAVGAIGSTIGTTIAYFFVNYINEVHTWLGSDMPVHMFIVLITVVLGLLGALASVILTWKKKKRTRYLLPMGAVGFAALGLVGFITALLIVQANPPVMDYALGNGDQKAIGLVEYLQGNFTVVIWDKRVYFFDSIPNKLDPVEVTVFVVVAIGASIIGALLPAIKAAAIHPVHSLRYE